MLVLAALVGPACGAFGSSDDPAPVSGATCRAEADCQESATGAGATNLRGCNPRTPDCKGKGCAELSRRYPTVFPTSHVFVCD